MAAAVLAMDGLLLGAHALHYTGEDIELFGDRALTFSSSRWWSGSEDGSVMELFGHLKLAIAAIMLIRIRRKSPTKQVFGAWGAVLLAMAADDFFMLHERSGQATENLLQSVALGAHGERASGLLFWVAVALPLGLWLVHAHRRSSAAARRGSWALFIAMLPMVALGVAFAGVESLCPECLDGSGGDGLAMLRMTVKHLTMTVILFLGARELLAAGVRSR